MVKLKSKSKFYHLYFIGHLISKIKLQKFLKFNLFFKSIDVLISINCSLVIFY
jgi:hypothetical protein